MKKAMLRVSCPLCSETVGGEGEEELSFALQDHMLKVHDITDLCVLRAREGPGGRVARSLISCDPDAIREDVGLPRRGLEDIPSDEVAAAMAHSPGAQVPQGEHAVMRIRCPLCGIRVEGRTGDDLSSGLRDHMADAHDLAKERRMKDLRSS